MKYVIKGFRGGDSELIIQPSDEDVTDDYILNFMTTDIIEDVASVDILASDLRDFVDWLEQWCPHFREEKCEHVHIVDTFDTRYKLCSDCGVGLRVV